MTPRSRRDHGMQGSRAVGAGCRGTLGAWRERAPFDSQYRRHAVRVHRHEAQGPARTDDLAMVTRHHVAHGQRDKSAKTLKIPLSVHQWAILRARQPGPGDLTSICIHWLSFMNWGAHDQNLQMGKFAWTEAAGTRGAGSRIEERRPSWRSTVRQWITPCDATCRDYRCDGGTRTGENRSARREMVIRFHVARIVPLALLSSQQVLS